MKLGKLLHKIVILRPLLKLIGVKNHTVAAKIGEGLSIVDKAVNEPTKPNDKGVIVLLVLLLILMFTVVIAAFPLMLD
jgi:hypothetical protein